MHDLDPRLLTKAAREAIMARAAAKSLLLFGRYLDPVFQKLYPEPCSFMQILCERLEACYRGEIRRLIINVPPQHGKSYAVSRLFPLWALGKNPGLRFILSTYGAELSEEFSRYHLNMFDAPEYRRIFETRLDPQHKSRSVYMTNGGGQLVATGVGGPMYGRGAEFLIIDDPYKNWEEAMSPRTQENIDQWFKGALTRISERGCVILVMHRWVPDDLCEMLIDLDRDHGDWCVLKLKALAEPTPDEPDPLGRLSGEALHPGIMSAEALHKRRREIKNVFHAQYQQSPVQEAGRLFEEPIMARPEGDFTLKAWLDPAFGADEKKHDMNALVIGGRLPFDDREGRSLVQITRGFCWRSEIDETYEKVAEYCRRYNVSELFVEDQTSVTKSPGETMGPLVVEFRRRLKGAGVIVRGRRQSRPKHLRIVTNLRDNFHRIRWSPDIDAGFLRYVLKYTENAFVKDPADATASLVGMLLKSARTSTRTRTTGVLQPRRSGYNRGGLPGPDAPGGGDSPLRDAERAMSMTLNRKLRLFGAGRL